MAEAAKAGTALAPPRSVAGSPLERAGVMAGEFRGRLMAMPPARLKWMIASALFVAALCSGVFWYAGRTDWRVLFSGLDAKDTQQIAQELAAAGIPYRMTEDGTGVEVGADQVDKARIEVATKGMPQSGRMGFELFDKPNWVGSEFDEKVNYQRALEGELEHTIDTLAVVRSSRVNLVLPKESLFGESEQAAKASVVLQLRRSYMPQEQIEAIRSLVAGAVPNLSPDGVTLVDADGRINFASPTHGAQASDEEKLLEDKLVAMLEPTAGVGNVHATVNVAYDDSSVDKTDDVYDPASSATLTMHKSEQTGATRIDAAGVPGTASNTPGPVPAGAAQAAKAPATPAAPASAAAAPPAAPVPVPPLLQAARGTAPGLASSQKSAGLPVYPQNGVSGDGGAATDESATYAVTRHLTQTQEPPGRLRRVTAAVVINDRMAREGTGKLEHVVWKPRSPEEMKQLDQLARAAVGFDLTRGDQVVMENVSFSSNLPETTPPAMERIMDRINAVLSAQPGLLKTLGFCALCLILLTTVVKPVSRQMIAALSLAPVSALEAGSTPAIAAGSGVFGQSNAASFLARPRTTDTQAVYEQISQQIRKEPAQSTRLLESWINAPKDEDN